MDQKRNSFDIVLRFFGFPIDLDRPGGIWLTGRLCGFWPGDAPGGTPWADWGNAAVNESLTTTSTGGPQSAESYG